MLRVSELLIPAVALTLLVPIGCADKNHEGAREERVELAPLHFSDDTPSLILTWLDERGNAHTGDTPKRVPDDQRTFVRVLAGDGEAGAYDPIYVANLGEPDADGRYTARSTPRSAWEGEIERRRRKEPPTADDDRPREPARRPQEPRIPPPDRPGAPAPEPAVPDASGYVIVYGASWCGPCHQAREHLKKRGIKVQYKDIDNDPAAASEMRAKLEKSGQRRGSIPVIDIGGKIIVGYSRGAIDGALARLERGTAL